MMYQHGLGVCVYGLSESKHVKLKNPIHLSVNDNVSNFNCARVTAFILDLGWGGVGWAEVCVCVCVCLGMDGWVGVG